MWAIGNALENGTDETAQHTGAMDFVGETTLCFNSVLCNIAEIIFPWLVITNVSNRS